MPTTPNVIRRQSRRSIALVIAQLVVGLGLVGMAWISDLSLLGRLVGMALAAVVSLGLVALTVDRGSVRRGLACLVGGIIGVCVGGGIGPAWLATDGVSAVAVVAVAALVAGLVLLAVGAWYLIRATPGWWRLAAIPVAFAIVQFVLIPLAGAVYGTHPPSTPLEASLPAGAEVVAFDAADGTHLTGWYTPSRAGAAVIVLPGSGGTKGATVGHAAVLAEHGYGVLALDSRGTGESGGVAQAWGWKGPHDVAGAVAWLAARPEVDPERIGVLGLSMGGEIALTAGAQVPGIAAVVAEGVSARVPADLAYLPTDATGTISRLDAEIMWAAAGLMSDAARPMPLTSAVAQLGGPALIIVGNAPEEVSAAPLLVESAPDLRVWEVDAPHTGALGRFPEEWEARVVGFLDEALGGQEASADQRVGPDRVTT